MAIKAKRTIIGKHALILSIRGEKELASQVFVYDQFREVRVNLEQLEVKILMTYDEDYFRVFKIIVPEEAGETELKKAQQNVLKFYGDLLNAASKFSREELNMLAKQEKAKIEDFAKLNKPQDQKEK